MKKLLGQFVPVRLVNMKGVDLNTFLFDYDLTFAVLMMDAEGHTYSRFGTRDAGTPTGRMSIAGLKKVMDEILILHERRKTIGAGTPPVSRPRTLEDFPSFKKSKAAREECYHCHFAHNHRLRELRNEGKLRKESVYRHPHPETVGISLDVDSNNVVKSVLPGSPAARSGVRPGDVITRAEDTTVLTSADLQFALDAVPDPGKVALHVFRGEKPLELRLDLPPGWRKTDVSWRASQEELSPSIGFWGEELSESKKKERGIPAGKLGLKVTFLFPGSRWAKTRGALAMSDVIVGLNGEELTGMNTRQFHSHFRMSYSVGETVKVNVLRGKERIEVPVPCLEVREE